MKPSKYNNTLVLFWYHQIQICTNKRKYKKNKIDIRNDHTFLELLPYFLFQYRKLHDTISCGRNECIISREFKDINEPLQCIGSNVIFSAKH